MDQVASEKDIVVVGAGAAGLAAAVAAAEGGARVAVFEKRRSLGGTSNFFEGTFAVESDMQRERYITYSRDQAFKYIMEYSHWRANPRLVRAIVNKSADTIAWLQKHGVEFSDATINMPDSPRTYHVIKGKGKAVVRALAARAREKGVEIRAGTPVRRVIKPGNRVGGVTIEGSEGEITVAAGAVVIASGGYLNNKEWVRQYTGFELGVNLVPVGNVGKMGEGIRMAWEAGAAEEGIGNTEIYRVGPIGPGFAMACQIEFAVTQPDLWVDPHGKRFCDEGIAFYDTSVGNTAARYKEGYTWSIFDDSVIRRMLQRGVDKNVAIAHPPGSRPLGLEKELKAALQRGSTEVFAADSIAGLAGKMGVDPSVLKATVDEYNSFCEKGHDDLFGKDPKYLWPIKSPAFYAVRARTVSLGSLGGIKINEKAEAVDKNDGAIPGLYAAGLDAGGMFGDSYPIKGSSGLASAFAINSGRIAGENALEYLGIESKGGTE
jgi:fumarate reductase flavoprotein subunit